MKRKHFLWLLLLLSQSLYAQDQTNFTQFYLNPYLLNPSFTGIDGRAGLIVTYRKQWATLKDGPEIANVTFHSPISKRVSLGISATNDKRGLLDNSGLLLSFGYNIPVGPQSSVRFGISGGISSNTVDLERLQNFNDPALASLLESNMSVLGNAGISFHLNTFHAGVSLPVIFEPSYISKDAFTITEIRPFESLIFHFSNRFYFNNDKNIFEPYFIYRMATNLPPQYEVAGILHLNHVVWVGASLKQDYGISALGGIKLNNTLAIGASYGLKTTGENELNSPTYEITLGLLFGKQRKKEIPSYSFVDTEKVKIKKGTGKSASELIAEKRRKDELARKQQLEELARKRQEEERLKKEQEALARKQREDELRKQQEAQALEEQRRKEDAARQQAALKQQQENAQRQTAAQQAEAQRQALLKQQEEEARRQQEEALRRQREEQARLEREALAKQQRDEEARRQQEEALRRQREEQARLEREALAKQQRDEEARRQREAQARVQQQPSQEQPPQQIDTQPEPSDPVYNSTIREDSIVIKHKPRFGHIDSSMEILKIEVTEHNEEDELERLSRLKVHATNPRESHDGENYPNAERHEFSKRGHHKNELEVADYVVSGVFAEETNARAFSDGLKKLGFKAKYGRSTEKGVWYVYLVRTGDINTARTERDNYRKMKIFRDAWLLTVHP